ncbi:trimeric intracellular cation channel family protein [Skermanella mucosa]|uniref:trimeric intracellular cation channel family protein n=1 Tax=Skermanella mucosa TaxID=1789672 RepID=UPI001E62668D|nr:trimeric intracellular cation channel family protein [Skermanella mucosa]UEM19645.1 trimeric intracellular cation channel family protein [Skermanella mucosa]
MDQWIAWLDLCGVAVFAASGALTASRKQMDVVGFCLVATVTGIGGGTMRDLLLGQGAVYWISAPEYVMTCIGVGILLFFTAPYLESRYKALLWADAAGLALFCVTGAEKALEAGAPLPVAVILGVMTATFGGIIRDVLCAEVPLILRKEIYATAAAAGALAYLLLILAGAGAVWSQGAGFVAAFGIRAVGIVFGVSLPVYRARPGRDY